VTFASANMMDRIAIPLEDGRAVSGLLERPARAEACYVLAHGAGAGMTHPFLNACAEALAHHGVATLRFQFPFLERGSRRPDPPAVAQSTVRAAVKAAAGLVADMPLIAGGRSFGGRMSSQAQASVALPGVVGLSFLGFPLHPAKRPSVDRAEHLLAVNVPMLFVQGTRDELANLADLRAVCSRLGERATLHLIEDADHAFHVWARSGRTDQEVIGEIVSVVAAWTRALVGRAS
jgi:predicted alpha/beta-hydrolase family hydrolase